MKKLNELQKRQLCLKLLNTKWGKSEKVQYKGKEYRIGKQGGVSGLNAYYLQTEECYNLPETANYTIGKDAWLVAENDVDLADWEVSKEILLTENPT